MKKGFRQLLEEATVEIETLGVSDAIALQGKSDVLFVDLRDPRELEKEGRIPGAFHCPRGMLEFWIDPESPYHRKPFAEPKRFLFFCAGGWRSALAARPRRIWDWRRSPIWRAASGHGAKRAARSRWSLIVSS